MATDVEAWRKQRANEWHAFKLVLHEVGVLAGKLGRLARTLQRLEAEDNGE